MNHNIEYFNKEIERVRDVYRTNVEKGYIKGAESLKVYREEVDAEIEWLEMLKRSQFHKAV